MTKTFKTIDEQLELLESRGLQIPNRNKAAQFLAENNYYRISGYSLTLREHDQFFPNATFQNIIDIYNFDHKLRHILLKHIETIEVKLKSSLAHNLSQLNGPLGYLSSANFTDLKKYSEIIGKSEKLKIERTPHEAYLKHFAEELQSPIPIWAYVELFSIADISILYKISRQDVKELIAKDFSLDEAQTWLLETFMHSMTILRNLCAHGSRIFNRLFEQKPKLTKHEKSILRTTSKGALDNEHLFSFILIMRRLLNKEQFAELVEEIANLSNEIPFVSLTYYGFPENWQDAVTSL